MSDSILIVEADTSRKEALASALTEDVFSVVEVSSHSEALEKVRESQPDLVIIDEYLPEVDGWETCHQLSHDYGVPVIMVGEDDSGEVWVKMLDVGADFYLKLPVNYRLLPARIKAILRRYRKTCLVPGD